MKRYFFLLVIYSNFSYASFDMNHNMQRAYSHITNLEFDKASEYIIEEENYNSHNGFIPLYNNYIDFLTIFITEDDSLLKKFESQKKIRLSIIEDLSNNTPYYLYAQAEIHLQWAFIRLKFDDYVKASYEFIRAYHLFERNQELYPSFTLNKKGMGLLHSLLGVVPEKYQWLLILAGLKGDIDLGLEELDLILYDGKYDMYKNEVLFLVSILNINLGDNDMRSKKYLDMIGEGYKDNYLLNFAAARLSYNISDNDYCIKVLENRPMLDIDYSFYLLDYLQAMSYLYKLDYDNATKYFTHYVNNHKQGSYIKSSYQKLAWISYLQNDTLLMDRYLKQVISKGNQFNDIDKVALREVIEENFSPHNLLKARLLYDGGYYQESLKILNKKFFKNNIEYYYRLARVRHKLVSNDLDVISDYQKVIDMNNKNINYSYYVPMSFLQIGLIYENNNKLLEARNSFNMCLFISNFDYQNGIHRRAKSSLSRIKKLISKT